MKKLFFLILIIALLLALDGALTYDIFDYRVDTFAKLIGLVLIIGIFGSIAWAESAKKHDK